MSSPLAAHTVETLHDRPVHIAFSSASAGNLGLHVGQNFLDVLKNREHLEQSLNLGSEQFTYVNQVHGVDIVDADTQYLQPVMPHSYHEQERLMYAQSLLTDAPQADAVISAQGKPLAIMVADCIPVIFTAECSATYFPLTAVAHAGRRGLLDGVLQQTVESLVRRGAEKITAWIGPSICGECYEVPEKMQEESTQILSAVRSQTRWGTTALDLSAGAEQALRQLPYEIKIDTSMACCTFENQHLFSHRRGEPQGRFAGLVWVENLRERGTSVNL
ncbi:polyphenol oxidase family protein [Rothia sp. CCM 9419]|uniref:polyphenol oxidase family protein n=1 Tax=Rothia sp. CCM 9419 TaxID=3402662 RepID=UPI003AEEA4CB